MLGETFGSSTKTIKSGKVVWQRKVAAWPVGGKIDNLSSFNSGDIIPAGTMAIFDAVNKEVTAVIIPAYSSTQATYAVGALVMNGGKCYVCKTAIAAAEEWTAAKWVEYVADIALYNATQATYNVGDLVRYGGDVYINKTAIAAAEAFTEAKWEKLSVDFEDINGLIEHDIVVDDAVKGTYGAATANVVYEGVIYGDRLVNALPDVLFEKLKSIKNFKEA